MCKTRFFHNNNEDRWDWRAEVKALRQGCKVSVYFCSGLPPRIPVRVLTFFRVTYELLQTMHG